MSDLERALRAVFALDAGATVGPGFEARMARGVRARGRVRVLPVALAAAVAGAAVATLLLVGRGGEAPSRAALPPPPQQKVAAPARAGGGDGRTSLTEAWELVIRFSRTWSADRVVPAEEDPTPPPTRERRPRRHRSAAPAIDCGNDPLCPLVAPTAGRLVVATDRPARVFVDGQDVGAAPCIIELIPGRHRVTVRFDRGGAQTKAVVLEAGEQRSLYVRADGR